MRTKTDIFLRCAKHALLVLALVCVNESRVMAQLFTKNYTSVQEFFDDAIGSAPRRGLGGIVIPISAQPVSNMPSYRDQAGKIIGYNVYRRFGGATEWQRINPDPVRMEEKQAFERILGKDVFQQVLSIATGRGIQLNGQSVEISVSKLQTKSSKIRMMKTGDEYFNNLRELGTSDDVYPFLMNARSLPLLGMVYVDTDSSVVEDQRGVEYAVAPITALGEGEMAIKGVYRTLTNAKTIQIASVDSVHTIKNKTTTRVEWTYSPDQPIYSFALYRKVSHRKRGETLEGAFQLIDNILSRNDSTVVGDGVKRFKYSMRFVDTTDFATSDLVEYKVVPQDYLYNEFTATKSERFIVPAKEIPTTPSPNLKSTNEGVQIQMLNIPAQDYIDEVHLLRADGPDKEYEVINTFNAVQLATNMTTRQDTLIDPKTKQKTVRTLNVEIYTPLQVRDDVKPNKVYYYRTQTKLADGSLGKLSPYSFVFAEYKQKPATIKRSAIIAMPLDSVYERRGEFLKRAKGTSILSTISQKTVKEKTGTYLAWSAPEGEKYEPAGYYVSRSEFGEPSFRQVSTLLTTPEFIDTTAGMNQYRKVRYRITTVNVSGVESDDSEEVETYPSYTKPLQSPAANLGVHRVGAKEIEVRMYNYRDMLHIDSQYVYRTTMGSSGNQWQKIALKNIGKNTFLDTTVASDSAYQYSYSLQDIRGYESPKGDVVNVVEQAAVKQQPVPKQAQNLRVSYVGDGVQLRWDPIVDPQLVGYVVVRAGKDKVFEKRADVSRATIVFEEAIPLKTLYYYKVIPVFEGMQGLQGDELSVIRFK